MGNALVIIDMLQDFILPSGKLYFEKGRTIVDSIVRIRSAFRDRKLPVIYGNDAHPKDSEEFTSWTPHGLAGSPGAQIIQELAPEAGDIVFHKDSLSLFRDGRAERLMRGLNVSHLVVVGVATEYSIMACALDALKRGLTVTVVSDAIVGVDRREGDADRALEAMRRAGVRFTDTTSLLTAFPS